MSRILFAWELGANYGHLSRLVPIAEQLRAKGHEVFFAVHDLRVAAELLAPLGYHFTQAPVTPSGRWLNAPPANYAEMLIAEGFANRAVLSGKVRGWISLYRLYRPDAVVLDHAPSALLGARILGIPRILVGNGFEIPPVASPFPSIRPWEEIPASRMQRSEAVLLAAINSVVAAYRGKSMDHLSDMFDMAEKVLMTFPELDHYGVRPHENYAGPVYQTKSGQSADWPKVEGSRVFAYLRPSVPGFGNLLEALRQSGAAVVCVAPGMQQNAVKALVSERFRIFGRPVMLPPLLETADLAVSYGGIGTLSPCLLAGVPMMLVPQNVEQHLISKRVEVMGAGVVLENQRRQDDFAEALGRLTNEPDYRKNAESFQTKYAGFDPGKAASLVVQIIEEAMKKRSIDLNDGRNRAALH